MDEPARRAAARRISEPEPANGTSSADSWARAQVAADIYTALPRTEREAIASVIAETAGAAWLGHPNEPDEYAADRRSRFRPAQATLGSAVGIRQDSPT